MAIVNVTTYQVQTVYTVVNNASAPLNAIGSSASNTSKHVSGLVETLKGIGAAVVGGAGLMAAKHAFIDFNRTVQDAKISLSAMLQGNYDTTWGQATEGASRLYAEFQRFSQLTPVTTQEMLEFGRGITVSTAQAGGSIKDIIKITEQGVVAAKAFGYGGAYASLEITEMLMGNVSKRMRFVQQLLGLAHTNEEEFKKLDAKSRMALVEKVLDSDAMRNATKAFSTSFSGVVSTLEDKIQISLGRAGSSLFEKVTEEISRWSEWLDKNSVQIDRIIAQVENGLVKGFEVVKDAASYLVEHADEIIAIGKIWAVSRLAGAVGGGRTIGGIGSALIGGGGESAGWTKASVGGVLAVGAAAYMATTELMRLTGASDAMLNIIDPQRAQYERLKRSMESWDDALEQSRRDLQGKGQTGVQATNTYANMMGAVNAIDAEIRLLQAADQMMKRRGFSPAVADKLSEGNYDDKELSRLVDPAYRQARIAKLQTERGIVAARADNASVATDVRIHEAMKEMTSEQRASVDIQKATQKVMEEMVRSTFIGKGELTVAAVKAILLGEDLRAEKDPFGQGKPHQTNINIARVEVAAKDPDRWIAELDQAAKSHLSAPRSSRQQIMGR